MLIVPLEPLAQRLEAWLTLPSLSRWLTRTIRLGYAIQFTRRPPKFNAVLETSVAVRNAPVLRDEIAVLLAKDAIEPVPPAERRQGFYSPYFIIPKKRGALRPILVCSDRPEECLLSCFDPSATQTVPTVCVRRSGMAVRPFGLSLSPCVFTKVIEGTLTPLWEVGVNLAQSREQLGDPRDLVLRHLSQLGLRVNWEKSKLSPVQRISFLGVELDSVSITARLTEERA